MQESRPSKKTHTAKDTVVKTRGKVDTTTAAERVKLKKRKDPAPPTKSRAKKNIKKNIQELLSEEEDPSEHFSEPTADDDDNYWDADDETVDGSTVEKDEGMAMAEDEVQPKYDPSPPHIPLLHTPPTYNYARCCYIYIDMRLSLRDSDHKT